MYRQIHRQTDRRARGQRGDPRPEAVAPRLLRIGNSDTICIYIYICMYINK